MTAGVEGQGDTNLPPDYFFTPVACSSDIETKPAVKPWYVHVTIHGSSSGLFLLEDAKMMQKN